MIMDVKKIDREFRARFPAIEHGPLDTVNMTAEQYAVLRGLLVAGLESKLHSFTRGDSLDPQGSDPSGLEFDVLVDLLFRYMVEQLDITGSDSIWAQMDEVIGKLREHANAWARWQPAERNRS